MGFVVRAQMKRVGAGHPQPPPTWREPGGRMRTCPGTGSDSHRPPACTGDLPAGPLLLLQVSGFRRIFAVRLFSQSLDGIFQVAHLPYIRRPAEGQVTALHTVLCRRSRAWLVHARCRCDELATDLSVTFS